MWLIKMKRIEKEYRDIKGCRVTILASPYGYSIIYETVPNTSYNYETIHEEIEDTAENNFEAALKIAKEKLTGLIPKEEYDVLVQLPVNKVYADVTIKSEDGCRSRSFENLEVDDIEYSEVGDPLYIKFKKKEDSNDIPDSDQVIFKKYTDPIEIPRVPIKTSLSPEEIKDYATLFNNDDEAYNQRMNAMLDSNNDD